MPSTVCRSEWHTPLAAIRTSTSPARGGSTAISRSSSGAPPRVITAAGADSGLLVDRDMRRAVRRERLAPPAAPAVLQPHPRQARHQIELRRPRVPHLDRIRLDPAVGEVVVAAAQPLGDDVVDA